MESLKSTHLIALHKDCKAKLVDFGGWNMPVSYSGTLKEHQAVRERCGLFDVSHMGEVTISGENALKFCQWITTNDVSKLSVGGGQYSAMLTENAGFVDDLILYRVGEDSYFLCINAGNTLKDVQWIDQKAREFGKPVNIANVSDDYSQLALQGPNSLSIFKKILSEQSQGHLENLSYTSICKLDILGTEALVARTGYTGELGFEIYCDHELAKKLWTEWVLSGQHDVTPCGLGARDTLRLESCYPLYGNEMDETVSPYEIGIGWAVKPQSKDFIGKKALESQKSGGVPRKLVAFKLLDKGIARHGMTLLKDSSPIGQITSGSHLPTLDISGGLALVQSDSVSEGDQVEVDIRGKIKLATIVKKPLYSARVK